MRKNIRRKQAVKSFNSKNTLPTNPVGVYQPEHVHLNPLKLLSDDALLEREKVLLQEIELLKGQH